MFWKSSILGSMLHIAFFRGLLIVLSPTKPIRAEFGQRLSLTDDLVELLC